MPLTPLFASESLDAYYDTDNAWLYLDWKGPQSLQQVQNDCRQVTALIYQTQARKALNDNSHTTHSSWEMVMWVAKEYLPEAGRAGMEYVAWVKSPVLECRNDVDLMALALGLKPQVAIFDDLDEAYFWLRSMRLHALSRGT
jgi:hypothetical protein